MTTELAMLAWGCVLLLVHVAAAATAKTLQYGSAWNVGPRDAEMPPLSPLAGRLKRAEANFMETFPVFAAAVLILTATDLETPSTATGAIVWLAARIIYLPLYAAGVPYLRSLAWGASFVGIFMVLRPVLGAALG